MERPRIFHHSLQAPYDWPLKWQYVLALGLVAIALFARWSLGSELVGRATFLLLFSALLPLALLVRPGPFFLAALLGMLGTWFAFLAPHTNIFDGSDSEGVLAGFFTLSLAAMSVTAWLSQRAKTLREQHQRDVIDSARRQQLVSDAAPALISYIDAGMRYRLNNKEYAAWFGRTQETLYGLHVRDLLGEEAFRQILPRAEAALRGERVEFETEIPCHDGTRRFVHAQYVPDISPDGKVAGYYVFIVDISDRKRMEDQLRVRSEQFETLLNAAPLGVYLVDADLLIQQINPTAQATISDGSPVLGRAVEDVMRESWPRDLAALIVKVFKQTLRTGEPYQAPEFVERRVDGNPTQYFDWRAERILLADGRYGVVCYFQDVSQQVLSRQAIVESESRYRTLFESIDQGFCIVQLLFDDDGAPVDYRWLEVNPAFEEQTGMKNVVGRTIRELVPDIDTSWLDLYGDVALSGKRVHLVDYVKSLGRWFDIDAFRIGQPEQRKVAVLFADITDRKRKEEALRESERRFRTMADNAPVLIWLADTSGGSTYFNRQWLQFTGRTAEEELGDGWTYGLHPDDRERFFSLYRKTFDARERFRMEYRLRRMDGEYRWLLDEAVPRQLSDGTFAGYIGSCIDITERKHSEETLLETDRRKDEFLATLAHELRNPLAAISTATTVLGSTSEDKTRVADMAAIIARQTSRLVRLINDLLDVSRISRSKVKLERCWLDLGETVAEVVADCRASCGKDRLNIQIVLPQKPIIVHADAVRLSQVVNNLLENACKFTHQEGKIQVVVEREENMAVIRVVDSGIGMSRDQLTDVFEMFTQAEELPNHRAGGLGIGLSLARSIVELHGGKIDGRSEGVGKGSEFFVRLPIAQNQNLEPSRDGSSSAGLEQSAARRRIVAADDNDDSLQAMALVLRMEGHEVETAADGVEALEKILAIKPEVALLDIGMPGIDGYEVARQVRHCGDAIFLIAMTGWGQDRDKKQAEQAGFDAHLTKPVDLQALECLLQERLAEPAISG